MARRIGGEGWAVRARARACVWGGLPPITEFPSFPAVSSSLGVYEAKRDRVGALGQSAAYLTPREDLDAK